jgi:hypothetical protein
VVHQSLRELLPRAGHSDQQTTLLVESGLSLDAAAA